MLFKRLGIAFLFSFFLLGCCFSDVVVADFGVVLMANFDDVPAGVESSTVGLFDFVNLGTTSSCEPHTDNALSSPNSFKVKCIQNYDINCFWNISSPYEESFVYVGQINFSFYTATFLAGASWYMKFYDYNDNEVIRLKWSDTFGLQWFGTGGTTNIANWNEIEDDRQYLVITHNGTNQFNIKMLDDTFAVEKNEDAAGMYAGVWSNFSYIHFCDEATDASCETSVYFDDFYIDTSGESTGLCDNLDWIFPQQDSHPYLYNATLGSYYNYTFTVAGDPGSYLYVGLYNPSSVLVWSEVYGPLSSDGVATYHDLIYYSEGWNIGTYTLVGADYNFIDGDVPCGTDYMYESESFNVVSEKFQHLIDNYGNFFAVFVDNNGEKCYYLDGDHPVVAYYLNDWSNYSTVDGMYIVEIFQYCEGDTVQIDGFFAENGSFDAGRIMHGVYLDSGCNYGIYVFNCSKSSSGYYEDTLLYVGNIIFPCADSDGDGIGDDVDDTPSGEDEVSDEDDFYSWIAGLGIIIGFACFPMFVFKDNAFAIKNGLYIMAIFALIGLGISVYYNLVEAWFAYIFGAIVVSFISLSAYRAITKS